MNYFFVPENEFYFYKNGSVFKRGKFAEDKIFSGAKSPFCVKKRDGKIHVIAVNNDNSVIYIGEKKHSLCRLKKEIEVKRIYMAGRIMGFLMSVLYKDEFLLIHCVMGDKAQPAVIGKMQNEYFYADDERVYYTNKNGVLGFSELGDGKPDRFIRIADNAVYPHVYNYKKKEYISYKKADKIYINYAPKITAPECRGAYLTFCGEEFVIAWNDGRNVMIADVDKPEKVTRIRCTGNSDICYVSDGYNEFFTYTPFLEKTVRKKEL